MRHKLCWRVAAVIWSIAIGTRAVPIDDQKDETPFSRASVESLPDAQRNANIRIADNSEFGSRSLPLRTAVESVPAPSFRYIQSERLPLRDAVEKRPDAYDAHLSVITKEFENLGIDPWSKFDSVEEEDNGEDQRNPNADNHYYGAAKPLNNLAKGYNYDAYDSSSLDKKLNYQEEDKRGKYHKGNANLEEMRQTADWLPENSLPLVVCYIKGWAAYREAPLEFNANSLPGKKCSHIHYAFATIDPDSYTITSTNEDYDVIKGGYRMVTGLKQEYPELRTLISVGGDGSGHRLSEMVYNPEYRTIFVNSVLDFLKQHEFDGLDLHWTYPALENQSDKDNYIALLFELRQKFSEFDYTLSIVLPSSKEALDIGYDLPAVSGLVDYLTVHAWDMNNHDRKIIPETAQHHSQLLPSKGNVEKIDNVQNLVRYLLNNGVSNDKLVLGIPFFGRSYTLKSVEQSQPNAPIIGLGKEGPYTQTRGFLAYFEICMAMHSKGITQVRRDYNGNSYIVLDDQWVGFDDLETIKNKMYFVKANKLAGGAIWSVDMDDFRGLCGEKWPLLTALSHTLKDKPVNSDESNLKPLERCNKDEDSLSSDPENCAVYHFCKQGIKYRLECDKDMLFDPSTGECGYFELSKCLPGHSLKISVHSIMNQQIIPEEVHLHNDEDGESHIFMKAAKLQKNENNDKKVICYITNWAFYRRGDGKFVPEHMDTRLCTHVVYAYATLTPDTLVAKEFDPWTDIDNNLYERVTSLKDVKVLLGLGGWTDSSGDKYSRLVSSGTSRRNFITQLIAFLRKHNFRGIHLDWNYPVCWQSNCEKGTESDKVNLAKFAQEISQEFKKQSPPMELGIAVSGFKEIIDVGYDLPALGAAADFLSAMTYDYHGGWDRTTGHGSPLTARPGERLPQYTVEYAIKHLIDNGAPRGKLLLGLAFYGQTFRLEEPESGSGQRGLPGSPAVGPGESGEFTKQPGMLAYYEICYRIKNLRWQTGIQQGAGPYTYNRNQWVGYEDPDSIKDKVNFAMRERLGGVVAWTTDLDDFSNRCCLEAFPLLTAANRALGRISGSQRSGCDRPSPPVTPPAPVMTTLEDSGMMPTSSTSWPSWSSSTTSTQQTWWTQSTPTRTTTTPRRTTTTTTTTRRPITTTTTIASTLGDEPVEGVGSPCQPGTYTSVPTDCTSYLQCVGGEYHQQRCAPGLHWSAKSMRCDWPRTAQCKEQSQDEIRPTLAPITARPPTAATPFTTKKPTTQGISGEIQDSHIKPDMPCTTGTHYAHEICEKFYICDNGHLLAQNCAPGLAWNDKKNMCDFKTESTCTNRKTSTKKPETIKDNSKPSSPPPRPTQPQKRPDDIIGKPCRSGEYLVYPGDCSRYLHCMWGKLEPFKCSTGLHWHPEKKICDWPKRAHCNEVSSVDEVAFDHVEPVQTRPPPVVTPTRRPTTTTTMSAVETNVEGIDSHFKVVCYFTNWAWYRPGIGKYLPEDIDPTLCTHIVYGFAVLEYDGLIMKAHDSWADFDNKFYERVVAYKKMGLKVSLALGGWNDSAGDKYSRLVNNPAARAKFIIHAVGFLQKYDFDGLDLDWEYPKCWQVDCSKGPESDKAAFSAFVQEIAAAFKPHGLLLSSAVSPSKAVIDAGYDVPAMAASMDWIAVMTYDFHGQWDKKTGHVAPLFYHPDDDVTYFNADYAIKYWIKKGAPARKIIMGMPMYGQSFTLGTSWDTPPEQLARKNETGLNVPARTGGEAGEFTRAKGFLAYYEICHRINNGGWTVVKDPKGRMGPFAFKGDQWVSYDDVDIIKKKTQFVRSLNLGGAMIWALDLDDFRNRCGGGKHPLLNTIKNVLRDPPSKEDLTLVPVPDDDPQSIEEDKLKPSSNLPATIDVQSDETFSVTGIAKPHDPPTAVPSFPEGEFKVVCYFTNWAWYRQGPGKYLPSDIDDSLCTHIVYGFAVLDSGKLIIKPHDSWADIDNKFYEKVTAYKQKGIRVLIAIGGWNDSAGDKYSRLVNDASARKRFVVHVVDFIKEHNFDGLDLDWEYPKCWQVDCTKGPDSDKSGFASLVTELNEAFKPYGFLLSSAVSPSKRVMDAGYDVPLLSKMLDWIAVMAYDYHGQWDKQTGHVAPMYVHPSDKDKTFNANFTIHYWIDQGASPKKLVMGMPTYGQSFSLAESGETGLNTPTYGGGEAGEETRARGFLSFYEICERVNQKGWKVVRDPAGHMGPYATLGDQWVSFDDDNMITHKSEYVRAMGLGGAMIWALDLDDFHGKYCGCGPYPLLSNINVILRGRSPPPPTCKLGFKDIIPKPPVLPVKPATEPSKPVIVNDPDDEVPDSVSIDGDNDASVINDVDTSSGSVYPGAPCSNQMFTADPKDCNKYYLCNNGGYQKMSCPQQLHWNNDHCDWPASAKCEKDKKGYSRDLLEPSSRYKAPAKLICYFTNWAWYRSNYSFTPDDIETSMCTHIVYSYATLDEKSLVIVPKDSWTDIDNDFYGKVTALREKDIKVLIAVGGYDDSSSDKYSRLANDPKARAKFVKSTIKFLNRWKFDGLEMSWQYPVCKQSQCDDRYLSDRGGFAALMTELSVALKAKGLLLTANVSPSPPVVEKAYDVETLAETVDWLTVDAYDYHGYWEHKTNLAAPLYSMVKDDQYNVNYTINYWLSIGMPAHKLVLGVPMYGHSYTLAPGADSSVLGEKVIGPGEAGRITAAPGFLAFYEICENVKVHEWLNRRELVGGAYAFKGNQFVAFGDTQSMWDSASLAVYNELGGVAAWAPDLDDWKGDCDCGRFPLLRALYSSLRGLRILNQNCP